uniref:Nuclease inhibitor n=1 Tax=uncultured bacterium FLS18 TaxID=654935 RepID=C6G3Z8_9BACT|nr:nuclease inhibitor [uncultured bacterium FLS18]
MFESVYVGSRRAKILSTPKHLHETACLGRGKSKMPTSDAVEILLSHNRWATRKLLETCAALTAEQFHQRFEIGPGSLHDTTTHILGAMRRWGDVLAGRQQRPPLEGEKRTPQKLLDLLVEVSGDLEASVGAHAPDELVSRTFEGKSHTFMRGSVLTHVTTHGMHHRAQCLNMLRQLGVDPLPPSAVTEWTMMADPLGKHSQAARPSG